jgi:hypothetical protein
MKTLSTAVLLLLSSTSAEVSQSNAERKHHHHRKTHKALDTMDKEINMSQQNKKWHHVVDGQINDKFA